MPLWLQLQSPLVLTRHANICRAFREPFSAVHAGYVPPQSLSCSLKPRAESYPRPRLASSDPQAADSGSPHRSSNGASIAQLERLLSCRDTERAVQSFDLLWHLGVVPSKRSSNALLQGLCDKGRHATAWRVYSLVRERGVGLRYGTFQELINCALKAGEPARALCVFRDLQAAGFEPNLVTWCGLIAGLGRQRRRGVPYRQQAYNLWRELQRCGPPLDDGAAYCTGMNACIGAGHLEEAHSVLAAMRAAGLRPDVKAFNVLLKGDAAAGRVAHLPGLLQDMRAAQVQLLELAEVAPTAVTYNTLINAFVDASWLSEARAVAAAAAREGSPLDVVAYSTLIKGCCRAGDMAAGLALLSDMRALGVPPNVVTYSTLVAGCVSAGDVCAAERVAADMAADGVRPNAFTFNTLLRGHCAAGAQPLKEAAVDTLRAMGAAGVAPSTVTVNTLMGACLAGGHVAAVPRLFRALLTLHFAPDALSYTTLMHALTRLGRPSDAVRAYGAMERDPNICPDAAAVHALVDAHASAGRMPEARVHLQRAAAMAATRGIGPPVEAYGAVVKGYARLGDLPAALDVVREFAGAGGAPDGQMLDTLVQACLRAGDYARALQVVEALEAAGCIVDRERLGRVLADITARRRTAAARGGRPAPRRSPALERFKFWLGLPNRYYEPDWQSPAASSSDNLDAT